MSDNNILEYNIATKIAKLIMDYPDHYDCILFEFISKSKKSKGRTTWFLDKQGNVINGNKKCQ
jgi:hypothetical protein